MDVFLSRSLEELDTKLFGQLLAPLEGYHPLILHVTLVAHQDDLRVVPRVGLDLSNPAPQSTVRSRGGQ